MNKRTFVTVVLLALIAVSPVLAHHSLAGVYDLNKVERATGVVQKFAFTNPHGALHIAIKDKNGEVKVWQLTTGSANVLTNAGVTATGPNRVKNGDEITVTFNPALNGASGESWIPARADLEAGALILVEDTLVQPVVVLDKHRSSRDRAAPSLRVHVCGSKYVSCPQPINVFVDRAFVEREAVAAARSRRWNEAKASLA